MPDLLNTQSEEPKEAVEQNLEKEKKAKKPPKNWVKIIFFSSLFTLIMSGIMEGLFSFFFGQETGVIASIIGSISIFVFLMLINRDKK